MLQNRRRCNFRIRPSSWMTSRLFPKVEIAPAPVMDIRRVPHVLDIRSVLWEVTISPGRPTPLAGDRQMVECGQHLGTRWQVRHFFNCTLQQPRIIVQYSVLVGENLMLFHQPHPHYDHFCCWYCEHKAACPATTWTQSLGGLVLPPLIVNCWENINLCS